MRKSIGLLKRPEAWARVIMSLALSCLWALPLGLANIQTAQAQLNTPSYSDGRYAATADAPCDAYDVGPASGTVQVVVRSSVAADGIYGGPGYISWVLLSTGAVTSFVTFRDSGTANTTTAFLGGQLQFITANNQLFTFRPPIKFNRGLLMTLNGTSREFATVCTRLGRVQ